MAANIYTLTREEMEPAYLVIYEWALEGWADQVEEEWQTVRSGELSRAGLEEFYMGTSIRRLHAGEV